MTNRTLKDVDVDLTLSSLMLLGLIAILGYIVKRNFEATGQRFNSLEQQISALEPRGEGPTDD